MNDASSLPHPLPRLAYLTTEYPSVSHTFIRREILALEALGFSVLRLAIRRGGAVADPADEIELGKTLHCLSQPRLALVGGALKQFCASPGKSFGAFRLALRLASRSDRGLTRHTAYLVEAAYLVRVLRAHRIQHLHVHFGTNPAAVALLIQAMGGPGFSMTIHGPDEFDAPIGLSLGDKILASRFTVPISSYGGAQLRRWVHPRHWEKFHIVRCSVGTHWFEAATPVEDASRRLVCIGRLAPQKGQILLLEAFAKAVATGVDGNLVLVGDGEMRATVEARIATLGLSSRVRITGWQSEAEVRGHLLGARAMILASFAEGLPVVLMEAMALQRPVITTYIAGIPELVQDGVNGWLVPAADVGALANAIRMALEAPVDTLRQMGSAGQAVVRERHSTELEAGKLAQLFQMLPQEIAP